jgi:hypothetical protein
MWPSLPYLLMYRSSQVVLAFVALGLWPALGWAAPQATQNAHTVRVKASAKVRKADPQPEAQPALPPPPPPTPEQMPAQPPQVSYLNGQLLIISRNSTLADILAAVRRQTGATIELPPGGGSERVAGRMGPGPARDVLASLLNGSRYDYVMIASATNPKGLEHVILTPKTGGAEGPSTPMAGNQPQMQPQPQQPVMGEAEAPPDAGEDQEVPVAEEPAAGEEVPGEEGAQQGVPQPFGQQNMNPNGVNPEAGQAQQGVKTPEQLLQELQRMQQLQQQQQQQQQQQNQPQEQE